MDKVRVYDLDTTQITEIPAAELAPGMICVRMEGVGEVWVSGEDIQQGDIQQELDSSVRAYLIEIKKGLDEVYFQSIEEWEEGFRRDSNPEKEIAIWLGLSQQYQKFVSGRSLSKEQKKDVFRIFLSCVNNGQQHALQAVALGALSKGEAQEALEFFVGEGE